MPVEAVMRFPSIVKKSLPMLDLSVTFDLRCKNFAKLLMLVTELPGLDKITFLGQTGRGPDFKEASKKHGL